MQKSFDMAGPEVFNKWNKDRLSKTPIKPGMIKNMPNQRYLDVSSLPQIDASLRFACSFASPQLSPS